MSSIGVTLSPEKTAKKLAFDDLYTLEKKLAKGSFGTVYTCRHKASGQQVAVKVIERKALSQSDKDNVLREVAVLKECTGVDNIVALLDFFENPKQFHLVQVYAEGGDVFDRLAQRTTYNEKDARKLAKNLLEAMKGLHSLNIAHRDLKPENLLLKHTFDDGSILVADFGFAAHVPEGGLKTRCGTPAFVAPELLVQNCRYDIRADMWGVGCLLYMLLGGYPPFQDQNHKGLFRKIRGADFCFHEAYWKNVSVSAKQLIASMLTTDPDYRCSAEMALEKGNWLKMQGSRLEKNDLTASIDEIKKFRARETLKGAVHAVMWSVRSKFRASTDKEFKERMKAWDVDDEAKKRVDGAFSSSSLTSKFNDVYELKSKIYESRAASIWECVHKSTQKEYAVKRIDRAQGNLKSGNGKSLENALLQEMAVLRNLRHPNIISVIDFFEDEEFVFLVMENMKGGDAFDRVSRINHYTEKDARDLARVLLEAIAHMHKKGFVHRDLKPQNILARTDADSSNVVLCDFGFACRVHVPRSLTTRCGTPSYVAPEILKNIPYDMSVDMWSIGVILYVLLCGHPPFADENQTRLFEKIRIGEWSFTGDVWKFVSDDAKDLITKLLVVDPAKRLTAEQALESKWLANDEKMLSSNDLSAVSSLMKDDKSHAKKKFKVAARAVMLVHSLGGVLGMNNNEQSLGMEIDGGMGDVEVLISRVEDDMSIT